MDSNRPDARWRFDENESRFCETTCFDGCSISDDSAHRTQQSDRRSKKKRTSDNFVSSRMHGRLNLRRAFHLRRFDPKDPRAWFHLCVENGCDRFAVLAMCLWACSSLFTGFDKKKKQHWQVDIIVVLTVVDFFQPQASKVVDIIAAMFWLLLVIPALLFMPQFNQFLVCNSWKSHLCLCYAICHGGISQYV